MLVRHRIRMFADMGVSMDAEAVEQAYKVWLASSLASGLYRAWLVETEPGEVVAGGGITVLPWPPGPRDLGDRLAFAYNVYTEPASAARPGADGRERHPCVVPRGRYRLRRAARQSQRPAPVQALGYRESPDPRCISP